MLADPADRERAFPERSLMSPVAVLNQKAGTFSFSPRLLLLEQDAAEAGRILRELQEAGIEVKPAVANNLAEFREALSPQEFDVALLDCNFARGERAGSRGGTPGLSARNTVCIVDGTSGGRQEKPARLSFAIKRAMDEQKLVQESARIHAALKESEDRAHDLAENAIYGIFRAGLDGAFHSANETLQKILGCFSCEELRALNLASDVFRYAETFALLLGNCRENRMVHNAESLTRPAGVKRFLHLFCSLNLFPSAIEHTHPPTR